MALKFARRSRGAEPPLTDAAPPAEAPPPLSPERAALAGVLEQIASAGAAHRESVARSARLEPLIAEPQRLQAALGARAAVAAERYAAAMAEWEAAGAAGDPPEIPPDPAVEELTRELRLAEQRAAAAQKANAPIVAERNQLEAEMRTLPAEPPKLALRVIAAETVPAIARAHIKAQLRARALEEIWLETHELLVAWQNKYKVGGLLKASWDAIEEANKRQDESRRIARDFGARLEAFLDELQSNPSAKLPSAKLDAEDLL